MRLLAAFLAVAAFSISASVGVATPEKNLVAPAEFVQSFYDWYAPYWSRTIRRDGPPARRAIKIKAQWFSPELRRALEADYAAQDKVRGYIVGIDFDPFLGGQDIEDRYAVGEVHQMGPAYRVNVYGITAGKKDAAPSAEVSVQFEGDHWVMTDFQYKDNGDLLATLKGLKNDRKKH